MLVPESARVIHDLIHIQLTGKTFRVIHGISPQPANVITFSVVGERAEPYRQ
jgi:hypothetical protein